MRYVLHRCKGRAPAGKLQAEKCNPKTQVAIRTWGTFRLSILLHKLLKWYPLIVRLSTNPKSSTLGHPPRASFGQRLPRLQSHLVELIVLLATLSSALMSQTTAPEKLALDIAVTGVTQWSSDLFEIHYTLRNNGGVDLYLPYHKIAGSIALTSYSMLHRTGDGAWTNIGPSYDVASYKAKVLQPGATLSLVEPISASVVGIHPGTGRAPSGPSLDVQSHYRIRVGYYTGAAAWQQRLNTMKEQQRSHKVLGMPRIEFAYSKEFQIPSAAK